MSIILISGGLDSAVSTAWALRNTPPPHIPISFYYGQRHARETIAAADLLHHYSLPAARTINLAQSFAAIGGSSLTSGLVHGNPSTQTVERTASELPATFVPGRNLIFLSVAAAVGYVEKVYDIVGGWNAVDYSGYPDCRQSFFTALERTLVEALEQEVAIHAPLVDMSKEDIIRLGQDLQVPFHLTWSCYAGGSRPCGECDSCKIRAGGFAAVGIEDPALV